MKSTKLKFSILLVIIGFQTGYSQEDSLSLYYNVLSFRYGMNQVFTADDYIDTYNNHIAFLRPILLSSKSWDSFSPFERSYTWALEYSFKFKKQYLIGLSVQYQSNKYEDKLQYPGLYGYDTQGDPIIFDVVEKYQFNTKFTPVLLFMEYRFYKNALFSPVVGLGAGLALLNFKWEWDANGNLADIENNIIYYIKDNRTWFERNEKKFIFQPRLRLELNLNNNMGTVRKYIDNVFFQIDYIYCKDKYDFFELYRNEIYKGYNFDDLNEHQKKLFKTYDVQWGGFQLMFGISIKNI